MNKKFLLTIATAIGITAAASAAVAAPLPNGTVLKISPSTDIPASGSIIRCTTGSCFAYSGEPVIQAYWIPFFPGTDGGVVIGKPQLSGGQEVTPLSSAGGELNAAWNYGANWGTFFTAPDATGNIFDDASCTGAACLGKTELKVLNAAWGKTVMLLGSAGGCNKILLPACTADMVNGIFVKTWTINPVEGGSWKLTYNQVVPSVFPNFLYELSLSGTVHFPSNQPPVVSVTPATLAGPFDAPIPFTITVTDPDGPVAPVCRVGTPPSIGIVNLTGCTSGTYTADIGIIGIGSFTVIANDGLQDSAPATVSITDKISPTAGSVNISGDYGVSLPWTPVVTYATSCRLGTPPSNGVASVASDCSGGYYIANIGFVGTDSFTYIASGLGDSLATVTAAITAPPTDTGCAALYPVTQTTVTGKQGHLSITVTGNLISVNPNGKEIKICPTTTASYNVVTNTPGATVVCQVKSNTSRGKGHVKVNDHIKCTDKPVGNDKLGIKIKSGVNQKAM